MEDIPQSPYYELLGIEITNVEPGRARARLPLTESLAVTGEGAPVAHGGAIASLADSVGFWAISATNDYSVTPTIDLRIDYLAPATDDMQADAEVVRNGATTGVADIVVETEDETIATARGVFKTDGHGDALAWD